MPINRNLNVAPYYDDFDITKKYYRVLFKPGFAVQARELTQLQTTLQNQLEQFGDNIFKEGSVVKGCTFTELRSLSYVKVADGIVPTQYTDKFEVADDNTIIEFYYELESATGLRAYIVAASNGFLSKAPDLNTFYINYLNTVEATQQKTFNPGETLSVKEYRIIKQTVTDPITQQESVTESLQPGVTVITTTVATFSNPTGLSYGLNVSEGIIFQKGHFLYSDDQTIVLVKYMPEQGTIVDFIQPHNISVGFRVDEDIINSQQDTSLLDNANGSENENAPGADRLKLSPVLISLPSATASNDSAFFTLRRYQNGAATQIRDISQYNVIGDEFARRTYEESGDYITRRFSFDTVRKSNIVNVKVGPGTIYAKGYRVNNESDLFLPIDNITTTNTQQDQPISFEYGGYVDVIDAHTATGVIDLAGYQTVNLVATNGTSVIGTAIIKNYTTQATRISTSGINESTVGRLYLFNIRMINTSTQFSSVRYVKLGTSPGTGLIEITPTVRQPEQSKLIFDLGQSYIKGISDLKLHTRKRADITLAGGSSQATITPAAGEVFTPDSLNYILAVGQNNTRLVVTNPEITNQNTLTFAVSQTGGTLTVYYSVRVAPTLPRAKQAFDVFIKTTFNSTGPNAKTRYTLGVPDAYKLLSVKVGSVDYTSSFRLVPNQKDDFYDHSYIEYIPGRSRPANNALLTVQFSVFRPDSSGVFNVFTVNSYAGINPVDIPTFSGKSGTYELKDCIDLRPHRLPLSGVTYSTNEAGASTISATEFVGLPTYTTDIFSSSDVYVLPALSTVSSADVEHYLNRTDIIVVDSYGDFSLITGDESTKSRAPFTSDKTPIAEIYIPGFPVLTQTEARDRGRTNYGVKITPKGVPNYTMADIKKIDDQIERLSYYVTLSALEAETKNLLIRDENGTDRFKNGIIVDPFNDLSIADVTNPTFNASIDLVERSLAPAVQTFPINLKLASSSGAQVHRSTLATLATDSSSVPVINQPNATNFRTTTSNFYLYRGIGQLFPEYDGAYDVTTNPKNVTLDLTSSFDSLVDTIQEFVPLRSSSTAVAAVSSSTNSTTNQAGTTITTTTATTLRNTVKSIQSSVVTNVTEVGDFVTDIRLTPYIRSREIKVLMYGLRPNTRHYFFFSGDDVNAHVAPAVVRNNINTVDNPQDAIGRSGAYGTAVFSNANGELYAVFRIPENQFFVGENKFEVADVDVYDNIGSASASKGTLTYRAYNFSVNKTDLTLSTRAPEYSTSSRTTTRTVTNREVNFIPAPPPPPPPPVPGPPPPRRAVERGGRDPADPPGVRGVDWDPLAQTFFIKKGMAPDADCLYVSKIDLYFKRKSLTNGVTVMIREVLNSYPTSTTLPFSKVHLTSAEVNVSEDASAVTTFAFRVPVRLDVEKEYAFVVQADADDPDYLLYTAKVGGTDTITNRVITSDTFDGVLFTSTNDRTWYSYQDEDVKFTLYRYSFTSGAGTVTLQADAPEFLTLSTWSGSFQKGELVYNLKSDVTITASLTQGSTTISATNIGSTYQVGDYIYVASGSGVRDLLRVVSVAGNNNSVTVDEAAKFTGTFITTAAVAGNVNYYNPGKRQTLYLENSSGRVGRAFVSTNTITGLVSGATGTIDSVDNIQLSFIAPSIERITDKTSGVSISTRIVDPVDPLNTPYTKNTVFNGNTTFNERGCIVYSTSNDAEKTLRVILTLSNTTTVSTPVVDIENALLFASRYYINDSDGDSASASYVSRVVTLAEGFDAEDFRLYVTGYRPNDTDIKAYIRVLNAADPLRIEDNPWIPLDLIEGVGMFSSTTNPDDFREFVYQITETAGANYGKTAGVVNYTNGSGKYSGYKNFQIRLTMRTTKIGLVPRLLDYRGVAIE